MLNQIILASKSEVRKKILNENKINCTVEPSNVDEDSVKESLLSEKATPEIISKNLAELKANKVSQKRTEDLVLGADSVIDLNGKIISKKLTAFDFYGPTCDSMDYMKGPFLLPSNVRENHYIELGQLGAYGLTFRTQFNGYYSNEIYEVQDNPIMTMYGKDINKAVLVA